MRASTNTSPSPLIRGRLPMCSQSVRERAKRVYRKKRQGVPAAEDTTSQIGKNKPGLPNAAQEALTTLLQRIG